MIRFELVVTIVREDEGKDAPEHEEHRDRLEERPEKSAGRAVIARLEVGADDRPNKPPRGQARPRRESPRHHDRAARTAARNRSGEQSVETRPTRPPGWRPSGSRPHIAPRTRPRTRQRCRRQEVRRRVAIPAGPGEDVCTRSVRRAPRRARPCTAARPRNGWAPRRPGRDCRRAPGRQTFGQRSTPAACRSRTAAGAWRPTTTSRTSSSQRATEPAAGLPA